MTFHDSLKIALRTTSDSGEPNSATIESLDRMGAFEGKPALRFIIATAIKNGTFRTFQQQNGLSIHTREIIERFITHTGFQQRMVNGIFEAYADALGWCRSDQEPPQPEITPLPSGQQLNAHLTTLLSIDREKEAYRGATIRNPAITASDPRGIRLTATLHRTSPMGSAAMHYALQSATGTVITTGQCALLAVTSPSVLPVSADIACNPHEVAGITLFLC